MYHDVVNRCHQEQIRTNEIKCIKLDEWYRLPMDHPSTCEYYLQKEFIDPLHLREDQVIGFNSDAIDPFQECLRIENLIQDISIDICILGLGSNGHLGLNEPADHLDLDIHVASLEPSSQKHSMLENVKVKTGMTLGMGAIFSSKQVLFLVTGSHKKGPYAEIFTREITTRNVATLLWLHQQTLCVIDDSSFCEDDCGSPENHNIER
jgi:galactosamine-6-phosphate isomerase